METCTFDEVLEDALLEFRHERWIRVDYTHLDFSRFSVAVLWLISQSDEYFVWTTELLRRHPLKDDQLDLAEMNRTYDYLFRMGRTLVWWFRPWWFPTYRRSSNGECQPTHAKLSSCMSLSSCGVGFLHVQGAVRPYNGSSRQVLTISTEHSLHWVHSCP